MSGTDHGHPGLALAKRHSSRQRQKDETRRRITEAAREVFTESGFLSARIDEIARRAGIGRTTFYLHFQTKADLANEIGMAMFGTFKRSFAELGRIDPDDRDAVREWVVQYRRMIRRRRGALAVSTQANTSDAGIARDLMDVYWEYADVLASALTGETEHPAAVIETARYMLLALDRMTHVCDVQEVGSSPELDSVAVDHVQATLQAMVRLSNAEGSRSGSR